MTDNNAGAAAGESPPPTNPTERPEAAPAPEGAPEPHAPPSAEELQARLDAALAESQERWDMVLRARAELENVRRRAERDVENAHRYGLERLVSELLPVKDSLELGLSAAADDSAGVESVREGVELTLRMLEGALEKFGVTALDPLGETFDPEFHQAMSMQEAPGGESGKVLTVVQKGYVLGDRLVRPAMVIVSS